MKLDLIRKHAPVHLLIPTVLMVVSFSVPAISDQEKSGDLLIEITGASSDKGKILWRMFNDKRDFEEPETGGILEGACEIQDRKCTFTVPALAFGNYAIMAGHDANNDQDISKNPWSDEPKGISNYNEKILWFPDFKKAVFPHSPPGTAIRIRLY